MNDESPMQQLPHTFSVAITGSGGSGAVTTGMILLGAVARCGFLGMMTRSAGPQIRGGESAAMVRYSPQPVECMGDTYDVLVALDWLNFERFADEIPLTEGSVILADPAAGEPPPLLHGNGVEIRQVPFKQLAAEIPGGRLNMVALGAVAGLCGFDIEIMEASVKKVLGRKGDEVMDAACKSIRAGYTLDKHPASIPVQGADELDGWNITGNQACGLGALRGGVRFVAAYPITPASEILEWLAPRLEKVGGSLLQAEDELASINMIIGASFGGIPSLTATSGPGLSLMLEGMGLALMSETPVTVINVMRGGPSTGIPTKSEQSDLNIALYGMHGDAPHIVVAPLTISDCVFATQWAVRLAEHLQTISVVLSDQALGQSQAIVKSVPMHDIPLIRRIELAPGEDYQRYRITPDNISPMSLPGTPDGMYTADGLEHNIHGTPSSMAGDHREQLAKRWHKLEDFNFGDHWAEIDGDGSLAMITWGSSNGVVREVARRMRHQGKSVKVIVLRLIMPLQKEKLLAALASVERVLVVEQNHGGQLFHYLHAQNVMPDSAKSLAQPGPLPLRPGRILRALEELTQ